MYPPLTQNTIIISSIVIGIAGILCYYCYNNSRNHPSNDLRAFTSKLKARTEQLRWQEQQPLVIDNSNIGNDTSMSAHNKALRDQYIREALDKAKKEGQYPETTREWIPLDNNNNNNNDNNEEEKKSGILLLDE